MIIGKRYSRRVVGGEPNARVAEEPGAANWSAADGPRAVDGNRTTDRMACRGVDGGACVAHMFRNTQGIIRTLLMTIVSSADVQKNFGRYKEAAKAEPVVVTQYGKPAVVILLASEYERLKELDRRVLRLDDMSDSEIEEMLQSEIPPDHRYGLADIPD